MSIFNRMSVDPGCVVLEYRRGSLSRVLQTGSYSPRSGAQYRVVDLRERLVPVALQEVLTSDAMSVRVSMTLRMVVTDAVAFTERAVDPIASVYLATQIALRAATASVSADDLIRRGDALDTGAIRSAASAAGSRSPAPAAAGTAG